MDSRIARTALGDYGAVRQFAEARWATAVRRSGGGGQLSRRMRGGGVPEGTAVGAVTGGAEERPDGGESGGMFELGAMYTRRQIHDRLGGTIQGYLPQVGGRVVCGAFKRSLNPNVPDVILVGDAPNVRKGAEIFCEQGYPVPVFLKAAYNEWEHIGEYQVERWTEDATEIAKHEALSGRPYVARAMFLKRMK